MKRSSKHRRPLALSPSIFREAAELIVSEEQDFACCALDEVSRELGIPFHMDSPACLYFERIFMPLDAEFYTGAWYGLSWDETNRMARSLGLLLCAILTEEGFEP